jgi:PAS domain S-box-containing protein
VNEQLSLIVLDNIGDGVISVDASGCITSFNQAAGRILKLDRDAFIGQPLVTLLAVDESLDTFGDAVLAAIYEGQLINDQVIDIAVQGEKRRLRVSTTLMRADDRRSSLGAILVFRDQTESIRRERAERLFGTYVDAQVVDQILAMDEDAPDRGIRSSVTVLFCDLEGFTSLSERLDPAVLLNCVNRFIEVMSVPISRNRGITDKFMGDAVMAYWGPPFCAPDEHATLGCRTGVELLAAVPELRRAVGEVIGSQADALHIRIGIATGEVVAGNVGTATRKNYTVLGDTVNMAARLEQINKQLETRLLCSQTTMQLAGQAFSFRERDSVQLRGRSAAEPIYEITGFSPVR